MPGKILVIQTAFLGDLFLSIPLLKAIKKQYPSARLGLFCRKGFKEFFLKYKLVDECMEVDKKEASSRAQAYKEAKEFKPDLIISAHQSFRTALLVWRLQTNESIGFSNWWSSWAYTKTVPRDLKLHDVERQLSLLQPLGFTHFTDDIKYPRILPFGSDKFKDIHQAVALAPGSQWRTKRWTLSGFLDCAGEYLTRGKMVVLVGAPNEVEIGKVISEKYPSVKNFIGKTSIDELAQLLHRCEVLISNDSGAMHVASVVGTPVISIFGPTVPSQGYAPWNKKSAVVEVDLSCRPCGAHGHDKCPIGTHDCMKKILSKEVITTADRLLS